MTDKPDVGRNPWWDPMGVWQQVGEPFADLAADQRLSGWGSSNALQALLDGLRAGLVGRPVVVGTGASRVAFTLTSLEASVGHLAAAAGQADDVALSAEDVEWRTYKFTTVSARLSNVHTRFRAKPVLVAAPVDVSLEMTGERLSALLAEIVPALEFEITASGRMLVRHARRPRWGYVEARPVVEHGGLVLRPSGVGRGARLWRFSRQIVPVRPKIALPDGVRITGVDVHPHRLEVQLRIDEWRLVVSDLASLLRKSR